MFRKKIEELGNTNKRLKKTVSRFQSERRESMKAMAKQFEEQSQRVSNRLATRTIQSR